MKTQLDLAMALRAAADFCEDPNSPKIHGHLCNIGLAWDGATRWCALGRVEYALGEHLVGNFVRADGRDGAWVGAVSHAFDAKDYSQAARRLRMQATTIERTLPVAQIEAALPVAESVARVGS